MHDVESWKTRNPPCPTLTQNESAAVAVMRQNRLIKAREGDLIETRGDPIFDVKGLVHPPGRIVAFIRYFAAAKGRRNREGRTYDKVYPLSERYALLQDRFPEYLVFDPVFDETLCEVPVNDVTKHYEPARHLRELRFSIALDSLQYKALCFAELLKKNANIPWESVGISGSIMIGLHTANSDIDPIVYGSENCKRTRAALEGFFKTDNELVKPYTRQDLKVLFDFRSKDTIMNFEDFVRTESRKALQGKYEGTDYFVRCVRDWNENGEEYGIVQYKNMGRARIEATVADDSQSLFTPCSYKIESMRQLEGKKIESIEEIASFRGRFCESAKKGEVVNASGKVEQVTDNLHKNKYLRLLIGGNPADCIILKGQESAR